MNVQVPNGFNIKPFLLTPEFHGFILCNPVFLPGPIQKLILPIWDCLCYESYMINIGQLLYYNLKIKESHLWDPLRIIHQLTSPNKSHSMKSMFCGSLRWNCYEETVRRLWRHPSNNLWHLPGSSRSYLFKSRAEWPPQVMYQVAPQLTNFRFTA